MIRVRLSAKRRPLAFRREILARAVAQGAEELRAAARELLDAQDGEGPSRPDAAPRRDSGRLRDSLFVRTGADGLSAKVGTDLDYGRFLEFGTRRMAARPWLGPAFESVRGRIAARLRAAARRALTAGKTGGGGS